MNDWMGGREEEEKRGKEEKKAIPSFPGSFIV